MLRIALAILALLCCTAVVQADDGAERDAAQIREGTAAYEAAYNRGDAAALVKFYTPDAVYVTDKGKVVGRDALLKHFEQSLKAGDGAQLKLKVGNVQPLGSDVLVEEGEASVTLRGKVVAKENYLALHVKRDGKWLIANVRPALPIGGTEKKAEAQPPQELQPLGYLVGAWKETGDGIKGRSLYRWTLDKQFLQRLFEYRDAGGDQLRGLQLIGYDAANKTVRSWTFTDKGSFVVSDWKNDGKGVWTIHAAETLADGRQASEVIISRTNDKNSFTWQTTSRERAGEFSTEGKLITSTRVTEKAPPGRPQMRSPHGKKWHHDRGEHHKGKDGKKPGGKKDGKKADKSEAQSKPAQADDKKSND